MRDAANDLASGKTCVSMVSTHGSSATNLGHLVRSEGHAASGAERSIQQSCAHDVTGRAMVLLALGSPYVVALSPITAASWTRYVWNL